MGLDDFNTDKSNNEPEEVTTSTTIGHGDPSEPIEYPDDATPSKIPIVDDDAEVDEYFGECYRCESKYVYLRELSNLGRLWFCTNKECINSLHHTVTEVARPKELAKKINAEVAHEDINKEDFNPKTMALDDWTGEPDEQSNTSSNKKQYERFTREEFEECLEETNLDFHEVKLSGTKELVYEAHSEDATFAMRVYSSLDRRTGEARDKGSDAIRTVVIHIASDKPVLKEKRTNRIKTWGKNLKKKVKNLKQRQDDVKICSECGRPMVIRENSNDGSKFYGCSGWRKDPQFRECSNTEPLN